jgi:NADPH2:quinone reductase
MKGGGLRGRAARFWFRHQTAGPAGVRLARRWRRRLRGLTERALLEGAAGRLRPGIGQRFLLGRAADARAAILLRAAVGKTPLEINPKWRLGP